MKSDIFEEERVGRAPHATLPVLRKLRRGLNRFDRHNDARFKLIMGGSQYSTVLTDAGRAFAKQLAAIALSCAKDFHTKATDIPGGLDFLNNMTIARKLDLVAWTLDTTAESVTDEVEGHRCLTPNFAIESCQWVIDEILEQCAVDEFAEVDPVIAATSQTAA